MFVPDMTVLISDKTNTRFGTSILVLGLKAKRVCYVFRLLFKKLISRYIN